MVQNQHEKGKAIQFSYYRRIIKLLGEYRFAVTEAATQRCS